jgi:hypothetical protein
MNKENQDKNTFDEAKLKHNYFQKLTYFDQLIDKCFKDTKESALSVGKWSNNWEDQIRQEFKTKISTFMLVEIIKEKNSKLYKKAFEEAKL